MHKSSQIRVFGARPAKGITPFIGLAVVMALALAAVFGSMSLANPAMAAIGQPGDAELTERVDSPQLHGVTVYAGGTTDVDLVPLLEADVDDVEGVPAIDETDGGFDSGTNTNSSNTAVATAISSLTLSTLAAQVRGAAEGIAVIRVPVNLADNEREIVELAVTVMAPEPATAVGSIPTQTLTIPATGGDPNVETIDVSNYFLDGKGFGEIATYIFDTTANALPGSVTDATATEGSGGNAARGILALSVAAGATAGTNILTVSVTYPAGAPDAAALARPSQSFFVRLVEEGEREAGDLTEGLPSFDADSSDPGSNTRYTIKFDVASAVNTLINDVVIEFHEDYSVPSAIGTAAVTITTGPYDDNPNTEAVEGTGGVAAADYYYTFNPEDVSVDGNEIFISIGDITEDDDVGVYEVGGDGRTMEIVFRQAAGISNPTENGDYGAIVAIAFGEVVDIDNGEEDVDTLEDTVPLKLTLDEEDGGLGTVVTATGKGYKNGTTLTVFRDKLVTIMWDHDNNPNTVMTELDPDDRDQWTAERSNVPWLPDEDHLNSNGNLMAPNGRLNLGEDVLCVAARIGGNDTGSCEFTVTHPTFSAGFNYINAVDGRDNYDDSPDSFVLEQSIEASPAEGSPGEIILIQMVDFPVGTSVYQVRLGRQNFCGPDPNPAGNIVGCPAATVDSTGSANFSITIPNWARAGVQDLRVDVRVGNSNVGAGTNVTIGGPVILSTPREVLANQRISLVGTGFSSNAIIGDDDLIPDQPDASNDISKISVGGEVISRGRINGGDDVEVDSGGNWSASVDLPLAAATTADGQRAIRVTDSGGRTGVVLVTVPSRTVTITPEAGRVGTIAVIRGTGFPSKNDEGSSFNVQIVYDAGNDKETTVSAVPDASGRFEVQLRVPTTASIPSTNTVRVEFEDDENVAVVTTVAHEVPEGIINLSTTSGGPGSSITVSGEGFKSFVPIALVRVGALDVTPSPKPSTDGNGMMNFDITIPGLDVGIQTIEVSVGDTTASTGFTVIESGVNPGDIKPVAEAIEELGDNLVSVWNFNNDTKVWAFYDPTLAEGNTLTHMITGETYLIRVQSSAEVILNNDTRSLTCVGDNCWNQVVW